MNSPFDLEDRLRETFDDIVPQLIVRARATQEVSLIGESAPPRSQVAGPPRRWSLLGAAAAVALLAGAVWAVSRPDESATNPSPTASSTTVVVDVPAGAPAWYAELRPWVPARFRHLALVDLSTSGATFEAIDPDSPLLWRIEVYTARGGDGTAQVQLTCDDGRLNLGGVADPCTSGASPVTEDEMLALIDSMPAEQVLARATGDVPVTLDRASIIDVAAAQLPGESELAADLSTGSASLLYGTDGAPDTQIHVVAGIWPLSYGVGSKYWAMSNIYAVRVTMADDSRAAERTLLAYKVAIAVQGQSVTTTTDIPEWYTMLRQAVPARFTHLAITRIEPHLARFVAIDMELGELLDLIVRDVPGPAVEVSCSTVAGEQCEFTDGERQDMIAAVAPGALSAAARHAVPGDLDHAVETVAAIPGWEVLSVERASATDATLLIDTGAAEVTVRLVGGVLPPAATPDVRVVGQTASWGVVGQYLLIDTGSSPTSVYDVVDSVAQALWFSSTAGVATTLVSDPEPLGYTDGFVPLPDGTAFRLYDSSGSLCVDEFGGTGSCVLRSSNGEWPAEAFRQPWSTGTLVYGLLEEPYVVTVTTPSSSVVQTLSVMPSQIDGIWICYGVLPSGPHYTVTVSTAAGTIVATQTLH